MGSRERRAWDEGVGVSSSLGDGLLDSASLCGSNSLTGIVHMQHGGWVGHSDHQRRGLVRTWWGGTGVAPCSITDSGPDTQAVMWCGGTGHTAGDVRAASELRLLHTSARSSQVSPLPVRNRLSGALFLQSQARPWCQALNFSWIPEPAGDGSDDLQMLGVACRDLGPDSHLGGQESSFQLSRLPAVCPWGVFSLSVVQWPSPLMGILNSRAGNEVPTKVPLAEVTLAAFVTTGLSPTLAAIGVGMSSQGVAQSSTVTPRVLRGGVELGCGNEGEAI